MYNNNERDKKKRQYVKNIKAKESNMKQKLNFTDSNTKLIIKNHKININFRTKNCK